MQRRGFLAGATALLPLVAGCAGDDGGEGGNGGDGSGSGGGGGYGGGGGGGSTTTTSMEPTTTTSETPAEPTTTTTAEPTPATTTAPPTTRDGASPAREAYPNYDWDQLERADVAVTGDVTLRGGQFNPLVAQVEAGATVTFTNEDSGGHTVTVPAMDVDEVLSGGESTTVAFEDAGVFDYVCTFHPPRMLGRVVVE